MDANALGRWTRFAAKGGIGKCSALNDCVAEKPEDLMFLKDDEIVVLMQIPDADDLYLGYCEGVVGRFAGVNVKFHGKLKRPVMTKRSSTASTSAKSPSPRSPSFGPADAATRAALSGSPSLMTLEGSGAGPSRASARESSPFSRRLPIEEIHDPHLHSPSPISARFGSPRSSVQQSPSSYTHTPPLSVQKKPSSPPISAASSFASMQSLSSMSPRRIPVELLPPHPQFSHSVSPPPMPTSSRSLMTPSESLSTLLHSDSHATLMPSSSTSGFIPEVSEASEIATREAVVSDVESLPLSQPIQLVQGHLESTLQDEASPLRNPKRLSTDSRSSASASVYSSHRSNSPALSQPPLSPTQPISEITAAQHTAQGPHSIPLASSSSQNALPDPTINDNRFSSSSALYDSRASSPESIHHDGDEGRPISTASDVEAGIGLAFLQGMVDGDGDDWSETNSRYSIRSERVGSPEDEEEGRNVESPEMYGNDEDDEDVTQVDTPQKPKAKAMSISVNGVDEPRRQDTFQSVVSGTGSVDRGAGEAADQDRLGRLSPATSTFGPRPIAMTMNRHIPSHSTSSLTPSLTPSLKPSEHGSMTSSDQWDGASDIYDNYRYSRYSYVSSHRRASRFSMASGGAGALHSPTHEEPMPVPVPPIPRPSIDEHELVRQNGDEDADERVGSGLGLGPRRGSVDSDASVYTQQSGREGGPPSPSPNRISRSPQFVSISDPNTTDTAAAPLPKFVRGPPSPLDFSNPTKRKSRPIPLESVTSPLLHTAWASPEASPEHSAMSGRFSAFSAELSMGGDRERDGHGGRRSDDFEDIRMRMRESALEGGKVKSASVVVVVEGNGKEDGGVGGLGRGIVVEDDEEIPEFVRVEKGDEDDEEEDGEERERRESKKMMVQTLTIPSSHSAGLHDLLAPPLSPSTTAAAAAEVAPLPPSPSVATSVGPNPFARPTLRELRGEPEAGGASRTSLFLPHPNAPKAPSPSSPFSSAGPMYIRDQLPPSPLPPIQHQQHQQQQQYQQHPPHPQQQRMPSSVEIMHMALQRRPPVMNAPLLRGPTIYARVEFGASMSPVPIFWSLEPPQNVPAVMMAMSSSATPPPALPPVTGAGAAGSSGQAQGQQQSQQQYPGMRRAMTSPVPVVQNGNGSVQSIQRVGTPQQQQQQVPISRGSTPQQQQHNSSPPSTIPSSSAALSPSTPAIPVVVPPRGASSGTTLAVPVVAPPRGASTGIVRTSSTPPQVTQVNGDDSKKPVEVNGMGSSSSAAPNSAITGTTTPVSTGTTAPIPRANFFPQVGSARPRSRSFSGFERSSAETELPAVKRSASPSSKPVIRTSAQVEQPSAAIPIRATSPLRAPAHKSPAKSSSLSNLRQPSPLSNPSNTITAGPKSSSPLAKGSVIADPSQQTPKPHPLRHVTSASALADPPTPTSPTALIRPLTIRKSGSTPGPNGSSSSAPIQINTRVPSAPPSHATLSPERERDPGATALKHSSSRMSKDGQAGRTSSDTFGRSQMTSPPPLARNVSLRSKLSLPNLRKQSTKSDDAASIHSASAVQSPTLENETVQVDDMDFELVPPVPNLTNLTIRTSEDSLIRGRESGDTPGQYLRTESPAFSFNSAPRSPTFASTRASDNESTSAEVHRQREQRWISLMGSSPASQARKSKKVKKLVVEGVPSSVRSPVWEYLTDCKARGVPGVYAQLGGRGKMPAAWPAVERDLQRCVKENPQLSSVESTMGHILQAYLTMAPDVRYELGLTLIVGQLLLVIPEENTFWVFVSVMDTHLRPYFSPSTTQIEVDAELFGRALEINDQQLHKKLLTDLMIPGVNICRPWFSSLFACSLPSDLLQRAWDIFLYEGPSYLIRLGLAISFCCRRQILSDATISAGAALNFLHHPSPNWLPPSVDGFISLVASFKLRDDEVAKQRVKMEQMVKKQVAAGTRATLMNGGGGGVRGGGGGKV